MPLKIIDHNTPEYRQMLDLRNEILRKPLGLTLSEDEIKHEHAEILIAAMEYDDMLGCCILNKSNAQKIILRQMAVKNDLQGKGIGRAILNFAEIIAQDIGYNTIAMHARNNAVGFYEKQGYRCYGEVFQKLGLPHILMEKLIL